MIESLHSVIQKISKSIVTIRDSHKDNDKNLELEIRILTPMTYEMGFLGATLLEKKRECIEVNNFIEVVSKKKDTPNIKIRSRTPFDNIRTMHMTPIVLQQFLKGSSYERKTRIIHEVIIEGKIEIGLSREEYVVQTTNDINTINFVSQMLCRIGHWVVDYKLKHSMRPDDDSLCSYILSNYKPPSSTIEIEYNGKLSAMTNDHIKELESLVFNQLFMTSIPLTRLYLNILPDLFAPIKAIKMDTLIMKQSDMIRNVGTLSEVITPKADGVGCFFAFIDGTLFINSKNSDLWKSYQSGVKETIYGRGEVIEDKIYPFFAYNPQLGTDTRLNHLASLHNVMDKHTEGIIFEAKEIAGPFKTREERCKSIIRLLENTPYPTDGIIFMNGSQMMDVKGCKIEDYKFKDDNTVDVLGVVVMNDVSFSGVPGINKKSDDIGKILITLFAKEGSKVERLGQTFIAKNDSLYTYRVDTKFFVSQFQGQPLLHFHKMILECSVVDDGFVVRNIRPDKTNAFYSHGRMGNVVSMIEELKKIQKGRVSLSLLEELSESFNDMSLEPQTDIVSVGENVIKVLNKDIKNYGDRPTSTLGILGHFVKTNVIYIACSPILSELYPPDKLVKSVLMIDGGSGADIRKYHSNGVAYYMLTDPSIDQLEKAEKLFKLTQERISKTQKGRMGSHSVKQLSILNENYAMIVKQVMPRVDVIDWQFALHYSWNQKTKEHIVNTLYQVSEFGTKLLISCFNGEKLRERLQESSPLKFKVSIDEMIQLVYIDDEKYSYSNNMTPVEEFFVDSADLIQTLAAKGFKLIKRDSFSNVIQSSSQFFDSLYLLETQESTRRFFNNINATKLNADIYQAALDYYNNMDYFFFIRMIK